MFVYLVKLINMKFLSDSDLIIGNKYVPISKSYYASMGSMEWEYVKHTNHPYLYYLGKDSQCHVFGKAMNDDLYGDYFLASDVIPYL